MKLSKNSAEKLLEKILELDPVQFVGICKIIGVDAYKPVDKGEGEEFDPIKDVEPREFYDIWCDVCDTIGEMNRTRRRNLGRLIYAATKKGED